MLLEIVLQLFALIGYYNIALLEFETIRTGMRYFEMICVIRNIRISILLKEIRIFRNMH